MELHCPQSSMMLDQDNGEMLVVDLAGENLPKSRHFVLSVIRRCRC